MIKGTDTKARGDVHDQERCMIRRRERPMIKKRSMIKRGA
jgi:hypothetical protein